MKLLHQLWHNAVWNIETHFENEVGDGFIFNAYSHDSSIFSQKKIGGVESSKILGISLVDLQFYWSRDTREKNFSSYPFHPRQMEAVEATQAGASDGAMKWIDFQDTLELKQVIIPNITISVEEFDKAIGIMESVNRKLRKKDGVEYFMTIALSWGVLTDKTLMGKLLLMLTASHIQFDGYYFVHEVTGEKLYKRKINTDFAYLESVWTILSTLKFNGFKTIYGFANWDAIVFASLSDIDYISIWTFENLRYFNNARFTQTKSDWGFSEGWYFSEQLLNFIKAANIDLIRNGRWLDLIRNRNNVYSDHILKDEFIWASNKPPIHKNYLLSISRLLNELAGLPLGDRKNRLLEKIEAAEQNYSELLEKKIHLLDESRDYHLTPWKSFLLSK